MKKRIALFFLYFVFWYLLFVLDRVSFLLIYFKNTSQLTVLEIIKTFIYGFKLDIAIASYIVFIPSLLLTFTSFINTKAIKYFYNSYTILLLILFSVIILGDLFMYRHWGFRMDGTPLFYMTNFKAMTASVSTFTIIAGVFGIIILTLLLYISYLKLFNPLFNSLVKSKKAIFALLPITLLLAVAMRGGIGIASLTTSTAYFSKSQFANHAAINPIWNVGFSLTESSDLKREYVYFTDPELVQILSPLQPKEGKNLELLKTDRPNIILFITESLTAKALEATGGRKGIMPELNKLVKEGVLFDHIYASGDRTDRGIAAVLAGYPPLPGSTPLKYQKLTEKLAFIPNELNKAGYRSDFYYGGTLDFANYRSFLVQAGFDKMVSNKDFAPEKLKSKWGAFDHVVFARCLSETPDNDTKFFKTILTLTSHEPFETPVPVVIKGEDEESKYLNSLHYTDRSFGEFIKVAKTRKWWDNTLVIIIADHGSRLPGNSEIEDKGKYHIPMIWLGGALKVTDTVIKNIASQTDLATTLLYQLHLNPDNFKFSKNILTSEYIPYYYFSFNNGFGFQRNDKLFIYNTLANKYTNADSQLDTISQKEGKAYLQSLYLDFFNKNK
jgi:phosphoglycerol transferase MdoB-like AlkP superfamily enzyme